MERFLEPPLRMITLAVAGAIIGTLLCWILGGGAGLVFVCGLLGLIEGGSVGAILDAPKGAIIGSVVGLIIWAIVLILSPVARDLTLTDFGGFLIFGFGAGTIGAVFWQAVVPCGNLKTASLKRR